MKHFLSNCLLLLTVSNLGPVVDSAVEVSDENGSEVLISAVTTRPETTYSGKMVHRTAGRGHHASLKMEYRAGEKFCFYTPVLALRNFTCRIMLVKFWDIATEITLSDSEGKLVMKVNMTQAGKRPPHAVLVSNNIPKPDIYEVCVRNLGSGKTIYHGIDLAQVGDDAAPESDYALKSVDATLSSTSQSVSRVASNLADMITDFRGSLMYIAQDYYRLINIQSWIDRRCIVNTVLILFTSFMSTVVIRRWFNSRRLSA